MTWEIEFEDRGDYLLVRVTGENSRDTVMGYNAALMRHCEQSGHSRVLIHEQLDGPRLSVVELFVMLEEGSRSMRGKFQAIALVDEQMGDTAGFAEDVGVNRGLPMAMFDTMGAAEAWLAGRKA